MTVESEVSIKFEIHGFLIDSQAPLTQDTMMECLRLESIFISPEDPFIRVCNGVSSDRILEAIRNHSKTH